MIPGVALAVQIAGLAALALHSYRSFKVLKPILLAAATPAAPSPAYTSALARGDGAGEAVTLLRGWVCLAALSFLESAGLEAGLLGWLPFYLEAKAAALVALLLPQAHATNLLFEGVLEPALGALRRAWDTRARRLVSSHAAARLAATLHFMFGGLVWALHRDELRSWRDDLVDARRRVATELASRRAAGNAELAAADAAAADAAIAAAATAVAAGGSAAAIGATTNAPTAPNAGVAAVVPVRRPAATTGTTGALLRVAGGEPAPAAAARSAGGLDAIVAAALAGEAADAAAAAAVVEQQVTAPARRGTGSAAPAPPPATNFPELSPSPEMDADEAEDAWLLNITPRHTRASISYNTMGAILGHASGGRGRRTSGVGGDGTGLASAAAAAVGSFATAFTSTWATVTGAAGRRPSSQQLSPLPELLGEADPR